MKSLRINLLLIFLISLSLTTCKQKAESRTDLFTDKDYKHFGDSISIATFAAIRSALMQAIADGGIENAIAYCDEAAMPITDSLSRHYGVKISRVSDKVRNPLNEASTEELELINSYRNKSREGAMIVTDNENKLYYKPIIIQAFCLNCHGTVGEELTVANNELIKNYYPDDMATDYKEGDLRGLWKVVFAYK